MVAPAGDCSSKHHFDLVGDLQEINEATCSLHSLTWAESRDKRAPDGALIAGLCMPNARYREGAQAETAD